MKNFVVVIHNTGENLAYFDTLIEAEAYITGLEVIDGLGVYEGKYVVDGPIEEQ